ncbi:Six-hairpin glycosidase, partial [Imleria badia]
MRRFLLAVFGLCTAAVSSTVDDYVSTESPIANAGLLANIGPSGAMASGAYPGVVIASPSTENPNYLYSWASIQQVTNPSGTVSTGGLGEPKFYINETAFEGPWGRPQRDRPALRSTAIITYANWLIANGNGSYVTDTLWPVIQLDLDYVANNW